MSNKPTVSESLAQSDRAIRELTAQRDELLAVSKILLKEYCDCVANEWGSGTHVPDRDDDKTQSEMRALIAKIEAADKQP